MSLAIGIVQNDYIITTSDSAVIKLSYDTEMLREKSEYRPTGKMKKAKLKHKKNYILNSKLLYIAVGRSVLTEVVTTNLLKRIEDHDDLSSINVKVKELMSELNKGKVKYIHQIVSNIIQDFKVEHSIPQKFVVDYAGELYGLATKEIYGLLPVINNLACFQGYIVGFDNDGASGLIDLNERARIMCPGDLKKGYPVAIAGHHPGHSDDPKKLTEYQQVLSLRTDERSLEKFLERALLVHGRISYESPVNVSPDCHVKVIQKTDNGFEYHEFVEDTSPLHEQFKLMESQ